MTSPQASSAEQLAAERTSLAATRTLMSADRTLMAWVRTSLALLGFAFTIYRILEELPLVANRVPGHLTPRAAGLLLAAMGTFAIVMGTVEYWQTLKMLHQRTHFKYTRPALFMALLMSLMGIALFVGISARFV